MNAPVLTAVSTRSLVGHEGVTRQHGLVKAIPETGVRLFVPSDLAARYDEQGLRIPVNRSKYEVEDAARAAGIPMTVVLPGNFAEFALATPYVSTSLHDDLVSREFSHFADTGLIRAMGVDRRNNRILFSGDSERSVLNLWYVKLCSISRLSGKCCAALPC
jgi:hypothetical protein